MQLFLLEKNGDASHSLGGLHGLSTTLPIPIALLQTALLIFEVNEAIVWPAGKVPSSPSDPLLCRCVLYGSINLEFIKSYCLTFWMVALVLGDKAPRMTAYKGGSKE